MADGLTLGEAARYLGVSTSEVMEHLKARRLHIQRVDGHGKGASFRIPREELDGLRGPSDVVMDSAPMPERPSTADPPRDGMEAATIPKKRGRPAKLHLSVIPDTAPRRERVLRQSAVEPTPVEETSVLMVLADMLHDQLRVLLRLGQSQPMEVRDELWGLWLKQARMAARIVAEQIGPDVEAETEQDFSC